MDDASPLRPQHRPGPLPRPSTLVRGGCRDLEGESRGGLVAFFASVSVPTLFYVIRKQRGLPLAQMAVDDCLSSLTIIPVAPSTLRLAATGPGSDFEDNLQIASAVGIGLDAIVARDPKGFVDSPIPVLSPADLLLQLSKSDDD